MARTLVELALGFPLITLGNLVRQVLIGERWAKNEKTRFWQDTGRPDPEGYVTPDGMKHDGNFWVGDTGGRIKGTLRFDLFAGGEKAFARAMKDGLGKQKVYCEVYRLPTAPSGYDPKTSSGVRKILTGLGYGLEHAASSIRGAKDRRTYGMSYDDALEDFQKQHEHIPRVEYGSNRGAVTLWYLTQAALAVTRGENYPVVEPGATEKTPSVLLRAIRG